MSKNLKNKIEATDISINSLLKDQKFYTKFKKYFSKMNNEDRLSKKGNKFDFF